ncbi:MAG: NAD(P)/FAD-dependent oxidoreductase [Thiobacillaceae bacterium]
MTRVVILGAGIAGVPAAYELKSRMGSNHDVIVVSDKDYFHFVPSNPWIAMGWRSRSDVAFPIAPYLHERGIQFICSGVSSIHPGQDKVTLENGESLFYDYLLITTGVEGAFDELPGLSTYTQSVLNIEQAEQAHVAYKEFVKDPGPIVVGAMQGSSILGPVYEYAFLADADLKRRNIRARVPITLVTPEPWPGHLGLGAAGVSRDAVTAALADTNITVISNARTIRVEATTIHIAEVDGAGNERQLHALPFAYSVYWPAFRGVFAVRNATSLVNKRGLVEVDEYLRNRHHPNVFAAGVCVAHSSVDRTPLSVGAPDSVYSIQREVDTAVRNILASIRGESLSSSIPQRAQWLSDMGDQGAAYLSEPQVPLRNINWMRQGRWVHLAKVDFEKYFVNKIRLMPAESAPSVASSIADVVSRYLAGEKEGRGTSAVAAGQPGRNSLELQLARDPLLELSALARSLGCDPKAFAAELLTAALTDAKSYLSEGAVDALESARRALMVEALPEHQPGVEFHGGGT